MHDSFLQQTVRKYFASQQQAGKECNLTLTQENMEYLKKRI